MFTTRIKGVMYLSVDDLILNKQADIVKYRHLKNHKIIKSKEAEAIIEVLRHDLSELVRIQNGG